MQVNADQPVALVSHATSQRLSTYSSSSTVTTPDATRTDDEAAANGDSSSEDMWSAIVGPRASQSIVGAQSIVRTSAIKSSANTVDSAGDAMGSVGTGSHRRASSSSARPTHHVDPFFSDDEMDAMHGAHSSSKADKSAFSKSKATPSTSSGKPSKPSSMLSAGPLLDASSGSETTPPRPQPKRMKSTGAGTSRGLGTSAVPVTQHGTASQGRTALHPGIQSQTQTQIQTKAIAMTKHPLHGFDAGDLFGTDSGDWGDVMPLGRASLSQGTTVRRSTPGSMPPPRSSSGRASVPGQSPFAPASAGTLTAKSASQLASKQPTKQPVPVRRDNKAAFPLRPGAGNIPIRRASLGASGGGNVSPASVASGSTNGGLFGDGLAFLS